MEHQILGQLSDALHEKKQKALTRRVMWDLFVRPQRIVPLPLPKFTTAYNQGLIANKNVGYDTDQLLKLELLTTVFLKTLHDSFERGHAPFNDETIERLHEAREMSAERKQMLIHVLHREIEGAIKGEIPSLEVDASQLRP